MGGVPPKPPVRRCRSSSLRSWRCAGAPKKPAKSKKTPKASLRSCHGKARPCGLSGRSGSGFTPYPRTPFPLPWCALLPWAASQALPCHPLRLFWKAFSFFFPVFLSFRVPARGQVGPGWGALPLVAWPVGCQPGVTGWFLCLVLVQWGFVVRGACRWGRQPWCPGWWVRSWPVVIRCGWAAPRGLTPRWSMWRCRCVLPRCPFTVPSALRGRGRCRRPMWVVSWWRPRSGCRCFGGQAVVRRCRPGCGCPGAPWPWWARHQPGWWRSLLRRLPGARRWLAAMQLPGGCRWWRSPWGFPCLRCHRWGQGSGWPCPVPGLAVAVGCRVRGSWVCKTCKIIN